MLFIATLLTKFLVSQAMSETCTTEWAKVYQSPLNTSLPTDYSLMYRYSGFTLNKIGNFDLCNDISIARYAVISYSVMPVGVQTFCGPISCSKEDYREMILSYGGTDDFDVIFPHVYQNDHYRSYDTKAILMILFILIISAIGLIASMLDYLLPDDSKDSIAIKTLLCFSVTSNAKNLLASRTLEKVGKDDTIEIFDGIRAIGIIMIIIGHTSYVVITQAPLHNYERVSEVYKNPYFMIEHFFWYEMDVAFWLAGFLMAHFLLIELDKNKSFTILKLGRLYLHRYLRVTVTFMFAIFFFVSLQEYLGRGPMFFKIGKLQQDCKDYWYTCALHLKNFIPDYEGNSCLDVAWFIPVYMQFSIFGPLLVLIYTKVRKELGWLLIFLCCACSALTSGLIANHFDLKAATIGSYLPDFFSYYYMKPYTRISPYALGIATAFIIYSHRKNQSIRLKYDLFAVMIADFFENALVRLGCLVAGIAIAFGVVFTKFEAYRHPGSDGSYDVWDQSDNNMFYTFDRLTFAIGITLAFLPLLLGYFNSIQAVLTGFLANFIGRLSFVMYLIHGSVMITVFRSTLVSIDFNVYTCLSGGVFYCVLVLVCALPIALLIEMPTRNIESMISSKNKGRKEID